MIKLALEEHFNWNDSRIMIYVVPGNPVVPVDPVIPVPDTCCSSWAWVSKHHKYYDKFNKLSQTQNTGDAV